MTLPNTDPVPTSVDTPTPTAEPRQTPAPAPTDNWEERYKGLQRVVTQRDQQIKTLQDSITDLTTKLEDIRTSSGNLEAVKGDLEKNKKTLEEKTVALTTEVTNLKRQLQQQGIIMRDYPELSGLMQYIPPADDEVAFRENAKKFATDMNLQAQKVVKDVLSGATPPQPAGGQLSTQAEEDQLWQTVTGLAGVAGKEKEYEEARVKWVKFLESKSKR